MMCTDLIRYTVTNFLLFGGVDSVLPSVQAFIFIHSIWLAPALMVVITYIMFTQVGWASLVPAAVVVLQVPLQIGLANIFSKIR